MTEYLFRRIISKDDVFYKHQQNSDPDLTEENKLEVLSQLYSTNKSLFIQRYGQYMVSEDCSLFDAEDPSSTFLLQRISAKERDAKNVRNRRFLAVAKIKETSEFFTNVKMREREPYLFDAMVGRFLTEAECQCLRPTINQDEVKPSGPWSSLLQQFEESQEVAERRNLQQAHWEHEDDKSKYDARQSRFFTHVTNMIDKERDIDDDGDDLSELREQLDMISKEEAESFQNSTEGTPEQLREEFEAYMLERFLAGKDSRFFDYSVVDHDQRLDDCDLIRERDEEEKWFDED